MQIYENEIICVIYTIILFLLKYKSQASLILQRQITHGFQKKKTI